MWAVVPVKSLANAKRRLSSVLDPEARRDLVKAMLSDVLVALTSAHTVSDTLVVTGDSEVAAIATRFGAEVFGEPAPNNVLAAGAEAGLNQALEHATQSIRSRGVDTLLVLPADLPLLTGEDVDALGAMAADSSEPVVLVVADRYRIGTNALLTRPPGLLSFQFGPDSARVHRRQAKQRGALVHSIEVPNLGLDIDTPADLEELASRPGTSSTQRLLASLQGPSGGLRGERPHREPKSLTPAATGSTGQI